MERKFLFAVILFLAVCAPAHAWDCTKTGQIRVQVPHGTIGNGQGNGPGQVDTVQGLTFQCQDPSTPTTGSNSSATGGNSSSSSTATGGNSSATQNQKQQQTQSANASASASGGNNTNNSVTNVAAPEIPVSSAYSQAFPTVTCFKGVGVGVQTMAVGTSLSGGKIDEGCDIRETARSYALLGSRLAACKLLLTNKRSRKAGVTLDDCMREPVSAVLDAPRVATPMVEPVTDVLVVPQPALPAASPEPVRAPTPAAPPIARLIGVCTFSQQVECAMPGVKPIGNPHGGPLSVSTICDQMLASAAKMLRDNPSTALLLVGNANSAERESNTMFPLSRAENVKRRLVKMGADPDRIQSKVGNGKNRTVEIFEMET